MANSSTPQTCAASLCAPTAGTGAAGDKLLLWLMVMNSHSTLQRCWALGHPWALTTLIKWHYLRIREAKAVVIPSKQRHSEHVLLDLLPCCRT